jgi:hypothetical protein
LASWTFLKLDQMQTTVIVLYTTTKLNPARLLLALEKEVIYQRAQRR